MATGATRLLAEDARADIVEASLDPLTYRPIAAAAMFTRTTWHVIDRDYAEDFAYLAKLSDGDLRGISLSDDRRHGSRTAVTRCSASTIGALPASARRS